MNDKIFSKKIGSQIKLARLSKKMTQEALAEKCEVSTKYISALEVGKSPGSVPLLINICNILDITPNFLFDTLFSNSNNEPNPIDSDVLIKYLKLSEENKNFINTSIKHLYLMQKINRDKQIVS